MDNYRATPKQFAEGMKDWQHWEIIGSYHIWCRQDGCDTLWNMTAGEKPRSTCGGYYNKAAMLSLKGIKQ